jgi:hypothetical protein
MQLSEGGKREGKELLAVMLAMGNMAVGKIPPDKEDFQVMKTSPCQASS